MWWRTRANKNLHTFQGNSGCFERKRVCVSAAIGVPANQKHWLNVVLMLDQRCRRWSSIETTSGQCVGFSWGRLCKYSTRSQIIHDCLTGLDQEGGPSSYQCLWRWPSIEPRMGQCFVFVGLCLPWQSLTIHCFVCSSCSVLFVHGVASSWRTSTSVASFVQSGTSPVLFMAKCACSLQIGQFGQRIKLLSN